MGTVLITGCSSGFGLASAVAFAERGDRVYATMRNLDRRGDLDRALSEAGVDAEVIAIDVTDYASVRNGIQTVLAAEGSIDVLVNNAGLGGTSSPIEYQTDDQWMAVIDTNLMGPVRMSRAVLPSIREAGSGAIVTVSSVAGRVPGTPITSAYAASKHAVCSLSDSLLSEVTEFGIDIACIEPGFFATSVLDKSTVPDWSGTPYERVGAAMGTFYRSSIDGAPGPGPVVDAILRAADGEAWGDSIHHPVGDDAEGLVAGFESMTYDDFQQVGRQLTGLA